MNIAFSSYQPPSISLTSSKILHPAFSSNIAFSSNVFGEETLPNDEFAQDPENQKNQ